MPDRITSNKAPNLSAVLSAVSPKVRRALMVSHRALGIVGVPHALAGGLAVGAYGYPRATTDVDWLVGYEGFCVSGKLVTMSEGIPYEYDGVLIKCRMTSADWERRHLLLAEAAAMTASPSALAIAPVEQIFRQKLKAGRARDTGDLVELLKRGVDAQAVRKYIRSAAPQLLVAFDKIQRIAEQEPE